jgi:hypothetical protein
MATVISGQTTVPSAGSEVRLHTGLSANCSLMVKALPANTGDVYVGNASGAVSASTGLPLSAGESIIFPFVSNLNQILIDSAVNNEGVAWLILEP